MTTSARSPRPRIIVTCDYSGGVSTSPPGGNVPTSQLGLDYSGGVEEAGGLPLVLPVPYRLRRGPWSEARAFADRFAVEVLDAADGLLLSGGPDLDPEFLGEEPLPRLGRVDGPRDILEMALAREALSRGLPTLGICRGLQVLIAAAGGGLYQDLAAQRPGGLKHRQDAERDVATHFVTVEEDSLIAALLRPGRLKVNSFHHQAVSRVPEGFRVSAAASDGVIEAVEQVGFSGAVPPDGAAGPWFVGVQWHPENLWPREPLFLNLFTGLIEAARRYRRGRGDPS
jgi:putative glutamine amidotransferase